MFVGYVPELPMSLMPYEMVRNEFEILGSTEGNTTFFSGHQIY